MSASGSSTLLNALQDEDFGWRLRIITEGEVGLGWFIGAVIRVLTPLFCPKCSTTPSGLESKKGKSSTTAEWLEPAHRAVAAQDQRCLDAGAD